MRYLIFYGRGNRILRLCSSFFLCPRQDVIAPVFYDHLGRVLLDDIGQRLRHRYEPITVTASFAVAPPTIVYILIGSRFY